MKQSKLRAGVIGLGAMGRHHVRVYNDLAAVDLIAVADVSDETLRRITDKYPVTGYTDIGAMLDRERLDVVSIVVPTSLHYDTVLESINRGVHVLVEKPIASTVSEAREMIDTARRAGVRLMVGHIERFNPAILELKRRIEQVGAVFQLSARRVGPFPDRIRDVGVVVDLASHDIDAMNFILESPVESAYAQTARRIHTSHEDMVIGTLRFANGAVGALDVNWLTPTKIRQLTVSGDKGTFVADYLVQDLAFYENGAVGSEWNDLIELHRITEGRAVRYDYEKVEPLTSELSSFVHSILDDTDVPASPESAADALSIALGLIESARLGQPFHPKLLHAGAVSLPGSRS